MEQKKKLVSIMIPCYNEEDSLCFLYMELRKIIDSIFDYSFELLFVNDGSQDMTLHLVKDLYEKDKRASYLDLSRNFGK